MHLDITNLNIRSPFALLFVSENSMRILDFSWHSHFLIKSIFTFTIELTKYIILSN